MRLPAKTPDSSLCPASRHCNSRLPVSLFPCRRLSHKTQSQPRRNSRAAARVPPTRSPCRGAPRCGRSSPPALVLEATIGVATVSKSQWFIFVPRDACQQIRPSRDYEIDKRGNRVPCQRRACEAVGAKCASGVRGVSDQCPAAAPAAAAPPAPAPHGPAGVRCPAGVPFMFLHLSFIFPLPFAFEPQPCLQAPFSQPPHIFCALHGRKTNFPNSKALIGVTTDRNARHPGPARM